MPEYKKNRFDKTYPDGIHFVRVKDAFKDDRVEHSDAFFTADLLEGIVRDPALRHKISRSLAILGNINKFVAGEKWTDLRAYCRGIVRADPENELWLFEVIGNVIRERLKTMPRTSTIDTPERNALRRKIIEKGYGLGAQKKDRKAWVFIGLPGAGKSTAIERILEAEGALLIDSDEYKKELPEYGNGIYSEVVHKESLDIIERSIREKAVKAGDNIVMQRTGGRPHKVSDDVGELKKAGYDVHVVYLDLPLDKAIHRSMTRFFEGDGRFCDPQFLRFTDEGQKPLLTYKLLQLSQVAVDYQRWLADVPPGESPQKLEVETQVKPKRPGGAVAEAYGKALREMYALLVDAVALLKMRGQNEEAFKIYRGVLRALNENEQFMENIQAPEVASVYNALLEGAEALHGSGVAEDQARSNRSEMRFAGDKEASGERAGRMVRSIRQNNQPATVFVDAEDFSNLSGAQKQEYLVVALSNKALHVVVYSQQGEPKDRLLSALLKIDHVTSTGKDLAGAQISFDRPNAPSIHLSKQILPSQELVQRLRGKVSFFKTQGQNGGTLAAALLWAWDKKLQGVSEGRDGFWIVAETLVSALQKSYDATLAFAVAA